MKIRYKFVLTYRGGWEKTLSLNFEVQHNNAY